MLDGALSRRTLDSYMKRNLEVPIAYICGGISNFYGDRLRAIAIHGAYARGDQQPDSKLEMLIVAKTLPPTPPSRLMEYEAMESGIHNWYRSRVSPTLLLPQELLGQTSISEADMKGILILRDVGTLKAYLEDLRMGRPARSRR